MSVDSLPFPTPSPSPTSKPQSHKQKRLSKNFKHNANTELATAPLASTIIPNPATPPPEMAPTTRLLIASLGNPAPYLSTLHSAGHTLLSALATSLSHNPAVEQPPLQKSNRDWAHGHLSQGPLYTLWQSPVQMNVSGTAIATAWKAFQATHISRDAAARGGPQLALGLVVLHDELEAPLGSLKVRDGTASPKGHNGLKSIRERMPGVPYTRIGAGIGRPESREPGVVAAYVLRKMTAKERGSIEGLVGRVEEELNRLVWGS